MRFIVCGGRDFADRDFLNAALDALHRKVGITCVIEGEAPGADTLAREWAESRGVPVEAYPADWATHGRAAGPMRNQKMIDEGRADGVVAFDGGSGTRDMCARAEKAGLTVWRPKPAPSKGRAPGTGRRT